MAVARKARKTRKTFTLSQQSISYLEEVKKEARLDSASAALEGLIEANRRERELRRISDSVADYYSSLSGTEQKQERQWGEFGSSELSKIHE